jgi:uncharacterized damage-inducible protein DinB
MKLQHSLKNVFAQLDQSLQQLSPQQYIQQSNSLFKATIGQHVRHIIELFICLQQGYQAGIVDYDKRKRDLCIESDKELARQLLAIYCSVRLKDKALLLKTSYDEDSGKSLVVETTYRREVLYNLEHTIHHMALIRIGINEVSEIVVPEEFGLAPSTIKYKKHVHSKFHTVQG